MEDKYTNLEEKGLYLGLILLVPIRFMLEFKNSPSYVRSLLGLDPMLTNKYF